MTFCESAEQFADLIDVVSRAIDIDRRFPAWPFRVASGVLTVLEWDIAVSAAFGDAVAKLAAAYGDEAVYAVALEPDASEFREFSAAFPGFTASGRVGKAFERGMGFPPEPARRLDIADFADVFAVSGSSLHWALWAQRDWEIALLVTRDPVPAWDETEVPRHPPSVDITGLRAPEGWAMPLTDQELAAFRAMLESHGR